MIDADNIAVVLGLTGGTGTGKTSALQAIRKMGGKVIDCDELYHEMLDTNEELHRTLADTFGAGIFNPEGKLERQRLGELVFGDRDRLDQLNSIVFRFVPSELRRRMEAEPASLYAIDAISLFESGIDQMCDRTVAVTTPVELRVHRIMTRDSIGEQYARLRIAAQKTDEYFRDKCDYELVNSANSPEKFEEEAIRLFEKVIESVKEEKANDES